MISNLEVKGTKDWLPKEFRIRKYIFDIWRKVCIRYGFEEYLTPIFENAQIYREKSGEDVGGSELLTAVDRAGRELAIRPEMTPSVSRMVSKIYNEFPKPIKFFSIANFFRNEKPQKGRNREFWQLNFDIFGSNSIFSDVEILQVALDIMIELGINSKNFKLNLNHRVLIQDFLSIILKLDLNLQKQTLRLLDKWEKLSEDEMLKHFKNINFTEKDFQALKSFMQAKNQEDILFNFPELKNSKGLLEIFEIKSILENIGYVDMVQFNPSIIRGLDYYDGMIFEVFGVKFNQSTKALFGGGRYNGLANIFGKENFPSVGCAPGDERLRIFLEELELLPEDLETPLVYLPMLSEDLKISTLNLANTLREKYNIIVSFEVEKLSKALSFSNKQNYKKIIIFGENEEKERIYILKDLSSGKEERINF